MENKNRFDVIVSNGAVYENAIDLPEDQMRRQAFEELLTATLSGADAGKTDEVHYKAVLPEASNADTIQKIIFQEGTIIDYLAEHDYPERIRVVCQDDELATMYQMNYNFYYATEKSDRLGIEKWD